MKSSLVFFGFTLLALILVNSADCRPQLLGSENIVQTIQQTVLRLGRTITEAFAKQVLSAFQGGSGGAIQQIGDVRSGGADYES